MSFSIKLGNLLYKNAFGLYKPLYALFKNRQDAFEIRLLSTHVHPNTTVLDIGANIGFYARILASLVGREGKVHCFEPDLKNFERLKKTCSGMDNVVLNNKAAGPRTEKIKIYTSKELNVDHRTYRPEEFDQEIEIDATSMDDYMAPDNLKVDFIKMDIQGFEMQAIQGMEKILEKNPQLQLISEFWPYGLKKAGSSVTAYFSYLLNKGFSCFLLENNKLVKLEEEKVKSMEMLGKEHYFNIFATRSHV